MAVAQRALDSTALLAEIDRLADAGAIVAGPVPGRAEPRSAGSGYDPDTDPLGEGGAAAAGPGRHDARPGWPGIAAGQFRRAVSKRTLRRAGSAGLGAPDELRDLRAAQLRLAVGDLVRVALLARPTAVQPAAARRRMGLLHPHPAVGPAGSGRGRRGVPTGGASSFRPTSRPSGERLLVLRAGCSPPTWRPSCRRSRTSPTSSAAGGWTGSTSRPTTTCCSSSSVRRGDVDVRVACRGTPRCNGWWSTGCGRAGTGAAGPAGSRCETGRREYRDLPDPPRRDRVEPFRSAHLGDRSGADRTRRAAGAGAARALWTRVEFGLVLSSPRRRALDTATLAGFTGAYAPQVDEDLVEWAYGDYEGRTSEEIGETDPGWTIWTGKVPGGETAEQVATRLDRVVDRVQESGVERAIMLRARARAAGTDAALARVRRQARRPLPDGHQHGLDPGLGEGPARPGALELAPLKEDGWDSSRMYWPDRVRTGWPN